MDVPGRCLLISYTLHMIVAGQGGQGGSDRTALGLSLNPNSKSGRGAAAGSTTDSGSGYRWHSTIVAQTLHRIWMTVVAKLYWGSKQPAGPQSNAECSMAWPVAQTWKC